jgi:hypothetical protein
MDYGTQAEPVRDGGISEGSNSRTEKIVLLDFME